MYTFSELVNEERRAAGTATLPSYLMQAQQQTSPQKMLPCSPSHRELDARVLATRTNIEAPAASPKLTSRVSPTRTNELLRRSFDRIQANGAPRRLELRQRAAKGLRDVCQDVYRGRLTLCDLASAIEKAEALRVDTSHALELLKLLRPMLDQASSGLLEYVRSPPAATAARASPRRFELRRELAMMNNKLGRFKQVKQALETELRAREQLASDARRTCDASLTCGQRRMRGDVGASPPPPRKEAHA